MGSKTDEANKKFLEFDWKDDRWQKYLNDNLHPTPTIKQLMKYKKRWFAKNIDSNFDPTSDVGEEPAATASSKAQYTTSASATASATSNGFSTPAPTVNSGASLNLKRVTTVLLALGLTLTLFSLLPHSLKARTRLAGIAAQCIGLCAATCLQHGRPVLSADWWERALMSDSTQALMMALVSLPVQSFIALASPSISAVIAMCAAAKDLPELAAFKSYCEMVTNQTYHLLQRKADIEVITGFMMIFMGLTRRIHFLSVMIYWNVLRVKITGNPYTKSTFVRFDKSVRTYLGHPAAPAVLYRVYDKVASVLCRFANPVPSQQQQ